jgi:hypothetical protein
MACEKIKIGDAIAIVCTRRGKKKICNVCGKNYATRLCDYPVDRTTNVVTCDRNLCGDCAINRGELDFCPSHDLEKMAIRRDLTGPRRP